MKNFPAGAAGYVVKRLSAGPIRIEAAVSEANEHLNELGEFFFL
jgi:hypothetical protein